MKKKLSLFVLVVLMLFTSFKPSPETYDIEAFYRGIETQGKTMVVVDDEIKETSLVLVENKIPAGKYIVNVKRVTRDLYKVIDKNIYIQTKFCYKYTYNSEVVLIVNTNYSTTNATMTF